MSTDDIRGRFLLLPAHRGCGLCSVLNAIVVVAVVVVVVVVVVGSRRYVDVLAWIVFG